MKRAHHPIVLIVTLFVAVSLDVPAQAGEGRGAYLVNHVVRCLGCHSERDWSLFSGPIVPGTEGAGGVVGLFGSDRVAPPITAAALTGWSAAALAAALRSSVLPSGTPFHRGLLLEELAALTPDDALAIARHLGGASTVGENLPAPPPESAESIARGGYLVRIARCAWCHGESLSGGREIELPVGPSTAAANITLHPTAGIGRLDRAAFVDYFKSLDGPQFQRVPVPAGERNTAMPWPWLAGLTREDLGALYDYLRTLPVVP